MTKLMDPTPSEEKIRKNYLTLNKGKRPILLTATSEKYELTLKETLLLKLGLTSIKEIDRRQTRIARFNMVRANILYKAKKKAKIIPFFWKDPISLKPILFTSIGIMYRLSIIDRLMLKLNKTDIHKLNIKAVYDIRLIIYHCNDTHTSSILWGDDSTSHFNKYIRGYGDFFKS